MEGASHKTKTGVSSYRSGKKVRFDGVPQHDRYITGSTDAQPLTASRVTEEMTSQLKEWTKKRLKEQAQHAPKVRENFIESVFVFNRWQQVLREHRAGMLVNFHTRHKFLLHAHNETLYREMGLITASAGKKDLSKRLEKYQQLLIQAMQMQPTVKTHVNVLMHLMGFLKKNLTGDEKRLLLKVIDQFKESLIPLFVPIALLNHYVRKYDESYLIQQYYLNPHPLKPKARNRSL